MQLFNQNINKKELHCDICVVGSGFTALAFVESLSKLRPDLKILIAEGSASWYGTTSAHHPPSPPPEQKLYRGRVQGWIAKTQRNYLTRSRLRTCGGTSRIWSGWCAQLDPSDLSRHHDFSWPISWEELKTYYALARKFLALAPYDEENLSLWTRATGRMNFSELTPNMSSELRTKVLQIHPIRLTPSREILESTNCHLIKNAHLTRLTIERRKANKRVQYGEFSHFESFAEHANLRISADHFILAMGCIETTRQLLIAGFASKHLGCNFIEHPYVWEAARFTINTLSESCRQLYNANFPLPTAQGGGWIAMLTSSASWPNELRGAFRALLYLEKNGKGTLNLSWEQHPHNRRSILLDKQCDALGKPLVQLHAPWSTQDAHTLEAARRCICEFLQSSNVISNVEYPKPRPVPGYHPMGTTRMGLNVESGMTDGTGRIFESSNCYVLGASLFPSGGYANPTLTAVALAMRTAHHIAEAYCG